MTQPLRWAKVRAEASCQLRQGAWYRILRLTPQEAVLDVNARPVGVARSLLYMLSGHPGVWSVVPRPASAGPLPSSWGPRYAVCPACRERAHLAAGAAMRCLRCGGVFEIGWEDASLA
jgi:hypothetical protein